MNKAISTLAYTGEVTLSKVVANKKVKIKKFHNAGGDPLFSFLADCLVGNYDTAKFKQPAKVMLINITKEGTEVTNYTPCSSFVYLLSKPEKLTVKNGPATAVKYSFMMSTEGISGNFTHIGLYTGRADSGSLDNFVAICEMEEISLAALTDTPVLLIDWELTISNAI